MQDFTRKLWGKQNQHPGDRLRLFRAANRAIDATTALYPGSYVDIAASFVFPSVTYVDSDERAARFFSDSAGVEEIIAQHAPLDEERSWEFIRADYTTDLGLPDAHLDLLISLYAGFVSEACTRYLRPGGWLLANPSHGDVAIASIDPRYLRERSQTRHLSDREARHRCHGRSHPRVGTRHRVHQVTVRLSVPIGT